MIPAPYPHPKETCLDQHGVEQLDFSNGQKQSERLMLEAAERGIELKGKRDTRH